MERIAKYGNLITFIHVKLPVEFKIFVFIIQIWINFTGDGWKNEGNTCNRFPYSFDEPSPNCVNVSPLLRFGNPPPRCSKIYHFEKKGTTTTATHFPNERLVRTQLKSRNLSAIRKLGLTKEKWRREEAHAILSVSVERKGIEREERCGDRIGRVQ